MKLTRSVSTGAKAVVVCILMLGAGGCDQDVAGELATLSGAYLGDVVAVVVTASLSGALDVDGGASPDEHADAEEHSHDAEPLHDHEH